MERKEILSEIKELIKLVDKNSTELRPRMRKARVNEYTCTDRFASEKQKLFKSFPLFIGFSGRLKTPDDYVAEVPLILFFSSFRTASAVFFTGLLAVLTGLGLLATSSSV